MSADYVYVRMTVGDYSLYLVDYMELDAEFVLSDNVDPLIFCLAVDVLKDRAASMHYRYYSQHNLQFTSYNEFLRSMEFSSRAPSQSLPQTGRPRRSTPEYPLWAAGAGVRKRQ